LVPLARERGYRVEVTQMDTCPQLELPPTWEEYLSRLSARHRHEVRRKLRRLDQGGPALYYAVDGQGGLRQDMDDFIRLFKISRSDKEEFMAPEMVGFFQTMAHSMAEGGYLKLFFLEMEGVRVATALCFDYGDARYLYNSGFDPQYAFFSVGLLLKVLCLKEGIEGKKKRFDFLRGAEAYKYDLGGQDVPIYRCLIQRP
ncbi:MAG: GNAT family N-acetyltransferase, partial [Dehalococcoidia bacterium]